MATISACLIMKNEAKQNEFFKDKTNIDVCLSSLSNFCDEIIVVDTGSTDNSIEIAKQYTDKIFQFIENPFDFSNARNESFKKATKEWILWTDMDDYYSDENVEKILKLKPILDTTDSKYFSWYYDYRHFKGKCSYSFIRDRLLKNDNSFFRRYSIHEELVCNGKSTILEDVTTIHTCNHDNNVKYVEMFRKIEQHRELYPRELYYYGGELFVLGQIDKCLEVLRKFETTDYPGIYENKRTQDYLAKCYLKKGDCTKAKEHFLRYGAEPKKIYILACKTFKNDFKKEDIKHWLQVFIKRFFTQQFKRNCMPDGPKVGTVSLSPRGDLRMPSDASYNIWLNNF